MASNVSIQTKSERVDTKLAHLLESNIEQMRAALPKHMTAERMIRLAMTTFRATPLLQQCSMQSVAGAIMGAAQLGLEIGVLGQAYLVPYKVKQPDGSYAYECQLIPGYRGFINLMYRSGLVSNVYVEPVFEGDHFKLSLGLTRTIEHEPDLNLDRGDPAKLRLVYAVALLKDGSYVMDWMPKAAIDAVRKRARAEKGPWSTDYIEMAKKTVIRRMSKMAPQSIELHNAVELDTAADQQRTQGLTLDSAALLRHEPIVPPQPEPEPEEQEVETVVAPAKVDPSEAAAAAYRSADAVATGDPPALDQSKVVGVDMAKPGSDQSVIRTTDGTLVNASTGEVVGRSAPMDIKAALE